MSNPKWLDDIDFQTANMPFGDLNITITRHRSKTSKITFVKESKLAPKSNIEAFSDLQKLFTNMLSAEFSGKLEFDVDFKSGTISLITIKNKEIHNYGDHSESGHRHP